MLRGADEIYERFQEELGLGPKGVTPDGLFSLEEVECIGACSWAPAIQVNYDFHDEMKPELVPGILDGYRGRTGVPSDGSLSPGWKAQAEGKGIHA
jgi:NADH-quinone oxidoreductase subunit E